MMADGGCLKEMTEMVIIDDFKRPNSVRPKDVCHL